MNDTATILMLIGVSLFLLGMVIGIVIFGSIVSRRSLF